jgi:hypothetical protein
VNARFFPPALVLVPFALLQGCLVVDQARLEADMPQAPPTFRPDSARTGSVMVQAALKVTPGSRDVDSACTWKDFPVGGVVQLQQIWGDHWRGVLGGSYSRGGSAWIGAVAGIRTASSTWEMDMLVGFTQVRYGITGHKESWFGDTEYTVSTSGRRLSPWSQFALRWAARGSGFYIEERTMLLHWSALRDTAGGDSPLYFGTSMSSLGLGWKWEWPGGTILSAGARMVQLGGTVEEQALVQFQRTLF